MDEFRIVPSQTLTDGSDAGAASAADARQKRSRVLLSCAPCRASKLKCDRAEPCSQCLKKSRATECVYAPKSVKKKPPKGMAARLKKLEGMVRNMLDEEGNIKPTLATMTTIGTGAAAAAMTMTPPDEGDSAAKGSSNHKEAESETTRSDGTVEITSSSSSSRPSIKAWPAGGKVVRASNGVRGGASGTTYVGATHFMAILDDIEDLRSYFDQEDEDPDKEPPDFASPDADSLPEEITIPGFEWAGGRPRSPQDLLELLPPKHLADRLVMRFFTSGSASLHVVHKPAFVRKYARFWTDPTAPDMDMDWLALLFIVFALSIFFSSVSAPHELAGDNVPLTPRQRFRQYRAVAGWAISTSTNRGGRYCVHSPATSICAPFLLYCESEFLVNRSSQMNCYLLLATVIRIMLKMGLHRDATTLPEDNGGAQISVYDGEMRRRLWHLAIQLDLMVSFHLGLPSMAAGIESDTLDAHNLLDEDFDEDSTVLPPERSGPDYTFMTYQINKAKLMRRLGQVARQAHSLTRPTYAEVMELDRQLQETWSQVPQCLRVIPLEAAIVDPPGQVVQRFGLGSLYQKTRCVLHRRYLAAKKASRPEHGYSRRACLLAALALLEYQNMLFEGTKPGGLLCQHGWFVSSLAIHDFLLGATVVYIVLQNDQYDEPGGDTADWLQEDTPLPNKQQLVEVLKRSHRIWRDVAAKDSSMKKAPGVLEVMIRRIAANHEAKGQTCPFFLGDVIFSNKPEAPIAQLGFPMGNLRLDGSSSMSSAVQLSLDEAHQTPITRDGFMKPPVPVDFGVDATWLPEDLDMVDWTSLETAIRATSNLDPSTADTWLGPVSTDNSLDMMMNVDGPISAHEPFWSGTYMHMQQQ